MIRPGESIPATRNQAVSLIRAVDGDLSRLTPEQVRAVRNLYSLSDYTAITEGQEVPE